MTHFAISNNNVLNHANVFIILKDKLLEKIKSRIEQISSNSNDIDYLTQIL